MTQEFTAQMSTGARGWRLYVVLLNTFEIWPEHDFGRAAPVPTFTERAAALTALGYELVPGAEWEWCETPDIPEDLSSPVLLIATVRVRSLVEVDA
ncbi:DUF6303 family protein [Streptomyces malaysiensis]|uniref:DUF6303 family protein n=1 Tax=Streptomyces malaysiensis subsp. samsunensis TaxID=459658 RepID=A0A9X2M6E3_STRMQ|nr:DUF6303 family protein [Streptomyces samsunensis]MCQ8835630.1 DUF6303 family protein [Streptomyces samsunensis]